MPNIRFNTPYGGNAAETIYAEDQANKTLRPISSGEAYTGAGYKFGDEKVADPNAYSGYQVGAPINRADELTAITRELGNYQNSIFSDESDNRRRATILDNEIDTAKTAMDTEIAEFERQRRELAALDDIDLFKEYETLRETRGVKATEDELVGVRDASRRLEGDLRTATGNAGVQTESLFQQNLAEREKPLLLKEQTLNDRLSIANNYIQQALSLKEKDATRAAAMLERGVTLAKDAINVQQTRMSNLVGIRDRVQQAIDQGVESKRAYLNVLIQTNALQKMPDSQLAILEAEAGFPNGSLSAMKSAIKPQDDVISTSTDDAGYMYVVTRNADGVFSTHVIGSNGAAPTDGSGAGTSPGRVGNPISKRTTPKVTNEYKFTDTQINKGVSASGLSRDAFLALPGEEQNEYINGMKASYERGRLPGNAKDKFAKEIAAAFSDGEELGSIRAEIDNSDMPQADKEELKEFAEKEWKASMNLGKKIMNWIKRD